MRLSLRHTGRQFRTKLSRAIDSVNDCGNMTGFSKSIAAPLSEMLLAQRFRLRLQRCSGELLPAEFVQQAFRSALAVVHALFLSADAQPGSIANALDTIATCLLSVAESRVTRPKLMVRPSRTTRASASTSDEETARMKCVV